MPFWFPKPTCNEITRPCEDNELKVDLHHQVKKFKLLNQVLSGYHDVQESYLAVRNHPTVCFADDLSKQLIKSQMQLWPAVMKVRLHITLDRNSPAKSGDTDSNVCKSKLSYTFKFPILNIFLLFVVICWKRFHLLMCLLFL